MKPRRICFRTLVGLALTAVAVPVQANPYMPSFVEMLKEGSGERSSYLPLILIILFPVFLVIVLVESLAVRRFFRQIRFRRILAAIALINAITSVIGWVSLPAGLPMWAGFAFGFVSAVLLEWPLLALFMWGSGLRARTLFAASLQMNAASYALIVLALVYLIYVPTMGTEDRGLLRNLPGRIVLTTDPASHKGRILDLHSLKLSSERDLGLTQENRMPTWRFSVAEREYRWAIVDNRTGRAVYKSSDTHNWRPLAFSPDGRLLVICTDTESILFDLSTGSRRPISQLRLRSATFSPNGTMLAWIAHGTAFVVNCRTGKTIAFPATGTSHDYSGSPPVAWSPDGKFLAYEARHPSDYAVDHQHPDVRIISADGNQTVTVYRRTPESHWQIRWLP